MCRYALPLTLLVLSLQACRPLTPSQPRPPSHPPQSPDQLPITPATLTPKPAQPRPSTSISQAIVTTWQNQAITFTGIKFDSRSNSLEILDQPKGPDTLYPNAKAAGETHHALAAINAGFFNPDGSPLGLVISHRQRSGNWNTSSLGSALWIHNPPQSPLITRRDAYGKSQAYNATHALQAGPLLIDHSQPVAGLDPHKPAVRSILLWDGQNQWWLGKTSSCTLAELSTSLHTSPAPFPIQTALNLDGGRSTDLWISPSLPNAPSHFFPPWNRPVRNFLILKP